MIVKNPPTCLQLLDVLGKNIPFHRWNAFARPEVVLSLLSNLGFRPARFEQHSRLLLAH